MNLSAEERERRLATLKRINDEAGNPGVEHGGYNRHLLKVDAILKEEHRAEYERLLATPAFTGERALAWLRERGYSIGIDAVQNHKKLFSKTLVGLRHAARFADALGKLSEKHGAGHLEDVTLTRVQQIVMQKLFETCDDSKAPGEENKQVIDNNELADLAKVVTSAVTARHRVEEMRQDFLRRAREAAAEVQKAAKEKQPETEAERQERASKVADRVRELLGLPVWDDNEDWKYGVPEYERDTYYDVTTGKRLDGQGREVNPADLDENLRLKYAPRPWCPPGKEPLDPPLPHPRAEREFKLAPIAPPKPKEPAPPQDPPPPPKQPPGGRPTPPLPPPETPREVSGY